MKKRKTIQALWAKHDQLEGLSKADETDWLMEVADSTPQGSYMADLFTFDFCQWVRMQVLNDLPPDMYNSWQHETSHLEDELQKARSEAQVERMRREMLSKELLSAQAEVNSVKEDLQGTIDHMNGVIQRKNDELQSLRADFRASVSQACELANERDALKVQLWDLSQSEEQALLENETLRDRLIEADLADDEDLERWTAEFEAGVEEGYMAVANRIRKEHIASESDTTEDD
jgi:hypothetical protein